jgi:hypothetical protein
MDREAEVHITPKRVTGVGMTVILQLVGTPREATDGLWEGATVHVYANT